MTTAPSGALLPLVRGLLSFVPSAVPRRQRLLAGRHARVDGIPFSMPVNSEDTPALMAAFPVDGAAAARLLPGNELHPVRLPGGRGSSIGIRHPAHGHFAPRPHEDGSIICLTRNGYPWLMEREASQRIGR